MRHLEADIGHLHFPYPLGELAHMVFGRSRRTVVTYYSDIVRQRRLGRLWAPFARRLLRQADAVLATSPPHLAASKLLREIRDRCRIIPLGVDVHRFANVDRERRAAWRERLGTPLLLFVGRLRYYKGLPYLFAAMQELEDAQLAVVGEGPMARAWKREAARSRARERMHFLGELPDLDLPALLAAADVFVFPSVEPSEAFRSGPGRGDGIRHSGREHGLGIGNGLGQSEWGDRPRGTRSRCARPGPGHRPPARRCPAPGPAGSGRPSAGERAFFDRAHGREHDGLVSRDPGGFRLL